MSNANINPGPTGMPDGFRKIFGCDPVRPGSDQAARRRSDEGSRRNLLIDATRLWRESGVPERHKGRTLERRQAGGPWGRAYRELRGPLARGPLIVLLGESGTGKTQLAVDLLADICGAGGELRYLKVMDLFREIRSCYRPDGPNEVRTVDKLCRYAGLVLDEAHERSDSDWENRTLTNIIDRRYDAMRTTILVSNLTREAFAQAVGLSVVSRLHESGQVVVCDWGSFRNSQ